VLYIEDHPALIEQVSQLAPYFLREGLVFEVATTLAEGLEILRSRDDIEMTLLDPGQPDSPSDEASFYAVRQVSKKPLMIYSGTTNNTFRDLVLFEGTEQVLWKDEWSLLQVGMLLHYAMTSNRNARRLQKKCDEAEASAGNLQALLDDIQSGKLDPQAMKRVGDRILKIRDEVKSIAA
jgi:CheY-like chemotaxis protein